jgi:hypothetical protein
MSEDFNPRLAALNHAGAAEVGALGRANEVLADLANVVACGLVYVGDQIAKAVERPTSMQLVIEREDTTVDAGVISARISTGWRCRRSWTIARSSGRVRRTKICARSRGELC